MTRRTPVTWSALVALAFVGTLASSPAAAGLWTLKGVQANSDGADIIKLLEQELKDANYPAAVARVMSLPAARRDALLEMEDGHALSLIAWLSGLPADQRVALSKHFEKEHGRAASQALEGLRQGRTARPEDYYALAQQFPLTEAAAQALTEGGQAAAALGDVPAALAMFELARRQGWAPDPMQGKLLESLRRLSAGNFAQPPADLTEHVTSPGPRGGVGAAADKPRMPGLVPFDAPWYGAPGGWGMAKYFPFATDDRVILATWKNVTMLKESGQVVWTSAVAAGPGAYAAIRGNAPGGAFVPAVLWDVYGRPLVIVVHQPGAQGEQQFVLRAVRGSDGRHLWVNEGFTAAGERREPTSFVGSPAVAGRFVYGIAATRADFASVSLVVYCLDVMTGQPVWTTPLGMLVVTGEPLDPAALAGLAEPGIDGDLAVVAPSGGSVVAIGRFDGKTRWTAAYRASRPEAERLPGFVPRPERRGIVETIPANRYKTSIAFSGDAVIVMPQDEPTLVALDRHTGKLLWRADHVDVWGLAGATDKWAVLCAGNSLQGVDVATGKLTWRYAPSSLILTGPATVIGPTAIAPTARGIIQVNVADGKEVTTHAPINFRRILLTESGKTALRESGAEKGFGPPAK